MSRYLNRYPSWPKSNTPAPAPSSPLNPHFA